MSAGEITTRLASAMSVSQGGREILGALLPLLAEGEPVAPVVLAASIGWPEDKLREMLARLPNVETDAGGGIVGLGLTLRKTPHAFEVRGRRLYTWCALDALIFPAVLGQTARITSTCAATGAPIRLVVTPQLVREVVPAETVISLVLPGELPGLRASFCDRVSFFASADAAGPWLRAHPGGIVTPVDAAQELARSLAGNVFGMKCEACS
jgi:alkylmercury lyase